MQNSRSKNILKRPKNQENARSGGRRSNRNYGGDSSSPAPSVNSKYRYKNQNYSQNVYQNITGQYEADSRTLITAV